MSTGLVLFILLLAGAVPGRQATRSDPRDMLVYRALLAARIREEVNRFSAGAGIPTPAPVLAFDRTVALCRTPSDPPQMGCMEDERVVQVFEGPSPRTRQVLFAGALSEGTRQEIAGVFRQRNATSQPFPLSTLDGFIVTAPEDRDAVMKRESRRTVGISSFSLPAYSSDGHAVVYASYVCGGLCGYGWLFLLRQEQGGSWQVVGTEMLWIS